MRSVRRVVLLLHPKPSKAFAFLSTMAAFRQAEKVRKWHIVIQN